MQEKGKTSVTDVVITIKNVPADIFNAVIEKMKRQQLVEGRIIEIGTTLSLDYNTMQEQNFYDCVGAAITQQSLDTAQKNAN